MPFEPANKIDALKVDFLYQNYPLTHAIASQDKRLPAFIGLTRSQADIELVQQFLSQQPNIAALIKQLPSVSKSDVTITDDDIRACEAFQSAVSSELPHLSSLWGQWQLWQLFQAKMQSPVGADFIFPSALLDAVQGIDRSVYSQWICPLSRRVMTNPVYISDFESQAFDLAGLQTFLRESQTHPITGAHVNGLDTKVALDIKMQMVAWFRKNHRLVEKHILTKRVQLSQRDVMALMDEELALLFLTQSWRQDDAIDDADTFMTTFPQGGKWMQARQILLAEKPAPSELEQSDSDALVDKLVEDHTSLLSGEFDFSNRDVRRKLRAQIISGLEAKSDLGEAAFNLILSYGSKIKFVLLYCAPIEKTVSGRDLISSSNRDILAYAQRELTQAKQSKQQWLEFLAQAVAYMESNLNDWEAEAVRLHSIIQSAHLYDALSHRVRQTVARFAGYSSVDEAMQSRPSYRVLARAGLHAFYFNRMLNQLRDTQARQREGFNKGMDVRSKSHENMRRVTRQLRRLTTGELRLFSKLCEQPFNLHHATPYYQSGVREDNQLSSPLFRRYRTQTEFRTHTPVNLGLDDVVFFGDGEVVRFARNDTLIQCQLDSLVKQVPLEARYFWGAECFYPFSKSIVIEPFQLGDTKVVVKYNQDDSRIVEYHLPNGTITQEQFVRGDEIAMGLSLPLFRYLRLIEQLRKVDVPFQQYVFANLDNESFNIAYALRRAFSLARFYEILRAARLPLDLPGVDVTEKQRQDIEITTQLCHAARLNDIHSLQRIVATGGSLEPSEPLASGDLEHLQIPFSRSAGEASELYLGTPLTAAIGLGTLETLKTLLALGADVNWRAVRHNLVEVTPILVAVAANRYEHARELIEHAKQAQPWGEGTRIHSLVDVNVPTGLHSDSKTPLYYAVSLASNLKMIELLLDNGGADVPRHIQFITSTFVNSMVGVDLALFARHESAVKDFNPTARDALQKQFQVEPRDAPLWHAHIFAQCQATASVDKAFIRLFYQRACQYVQSDECDLKALKARQILNVMVQDFKDLTQDDLQAALLLLDYVEPYSASCELVHQVFLHHSALITAELGLRFGLSIQSLFTVEHLFLQLSRQHGVEWTRAHAVDYYVEGESCYQQGIDNSVALLRALVAESTPKHIVIYLLSAADMPLASRVIGTDLLKKFAVVDSVLARFQSLCFENQSAPILSVINEFIDDKRAIIEAFSSTKQGIQTLVKQAIYPDDCNFLDLFLTIITDYSLDSSMLDYFVEKILLQCGAGAISDIICDKSNAFLECDRDNLFLVFDHPRLAPHLNYAAFFSVAVETQSWTKQDLIRLQAYVDDIKLKSEFLLKTIHDALASLPAYLAIFSVERYQLKLLPHFSFGETHILLYDEQPFVLADFQKVLAFSYYDDHVSFFQRRYAALSDFKAGLAQSDSPETALDYARSQGEPEPTRRIQDDDDNSDDDSTICILPSLGKKT